MRSFLLISLQLFILLVITSCKGSTAEESIAEEETSEVESTSQIITNIEWLPFTKDIFKQAKEADKLVFLEVGANWCHWCHVMDEKTYADEKVEQYLKDHFLLCREDQDSRPDLYASYKKWGWPAIIAFDADGNEIMRLKGYQEKGKFLDQLASVVENPIPLADESPQGGTQLSASNQQLFNSFLARVDHKKGAYDWNNKYMHLAGLLHGLKYYSKNDSLKKWTDKTAKNSLALVDPVWSGVYQYSALKSWNNQHYEKLLRIQAQYIEGYSRYAAITQNERFKKTAVNILGYCNEFLGNETPLYYNSQNADVISGQDSEAYYESSASERLKQGVPSVDKHIYLKENAMMAKSCIYLWAATDNLKFMEQALIMTDYILKEVGRFKGVYYRETPGQAFPLSSEDNRQLIELLMLVYQYSGKSKYLAEASDLGQYLMREFDSENGMRASSGGSPIPSAVVPINNLDAVMTYNMLGHLTGNEIFKEHAQALFEKLDKQQMTKTVAFLPGLIKAREELENEPFHAVLISEGNRETSSNKKLGQSYFKTIISCPNPYIIFERAIIGEFTEEQEMLYGGMDAGTLFICTSTYCSAPIYDVIGLQEFLDSQ